MTTTPATQARDSFSRATGRPIPRLSACDHERFWRNVEKSDECRNTLCVNPDHLEAVSSAERLGWAIDGIKAHVDDELLGDDLRALLAALHSHKGAGE